MGVGNVLTIGCTDSAVEHSDWLTQAKNMKVVLSYWMLCFPNSRSSFKFQEEGFGGKRGEGSRHVAARIIHTHTHTQSCGCGMETSHVT